ncbi:MAG: imidazoleglycerol-phosphate dehydratase HisB [SAR202 cluster bacterium]|jgi:imidazoleglycerol-phosphate dehydratase|nr:imidazoleglycerol-phosphate dehydratase HisB [SAR202 cluster bacterium]MDP6301898.1 imidazoleglycerol-phosphate dehydratase HisB [SAR202 cluster bacterium]MDP7104746.1 imidazoleglycerol-phosphate dehydratase HisB [SAR202 cluster bacterium]MDP7226066.1 imidazoleglycerol-phosphate dehydratase HisB [SAR202 cluster bacterium]MDP7413415.1 imidazoleglycerol-phosphate dehydratase HisB [SAR202 cluster bacterium]|tara:strand:- start:5808 stop:6407 length:600 start_codon:yes stop_codon:yes gene_type:complete
MTDRTAKIERNTAETQIAVDLNLDGTGEYDLSAGNGMFEHLLAQLSRHGLIDLTVRATGDTEVGWHHLVEDTGIAIGRALKDAVGDGRGITRMGHSYVPLDETLAFTAVDFSGRGYAVIDADIGDSDLGGLPGDLVRHFLESMAREGSFNLHVRLISGRNNHHKAEAIFKSLARSIRTAMEPDPRRGRQVPSTKGTISE